MADTSRTGALRELYRFVIHGARQPWIVREGVPTYRPTFCAAMECLERAGAWPYRAMTRKTADSDGRA